MKNFIQKKWQKLSNLGVEEHYSISIQKRIILSNQIAIMAFVALFLMSLSYILKDFYFNFFTILNFLSIFSILSVPYMNKKGGYKISSIILSVLTPVLTLLMSTLSKKYIIENDITSYFFGRILIMSQLVVPLILIDYNRKITLIIILSVNLLCIFLFDEFHKLFNLDVFQLHNLSYANYYNINYLIIFPLLIILFGFYFLMNLNLKYEKKINQLVNELTIKNNDLEQKKEEITASLEEISSQKEIIENAYNVIEIKNKNITDSIIYAKRIQNAALPTFDFIGDLFNDFFIFYKPRDIVSGDFYWGCEVENTKIIVAADCTGHGVPGAFVSILGIALLKEVIFLRKIYKPNLILEELRNQIKKSLGQSGKSDENKDGMDLALCQLDYISKKLYFAGANNPLYYFKNNKLDEIKPSRQPIGVYTKEKPFTLTEIDIIENEIFYIFSDGFTSQFGGEKNEKFKSHRFKDLISEIYFLQLSEQKQIIEQKFVEWKGNYEQTDDVLVIGIKI